MASTPIPNLEPNPLQKALETYHELERQHREAVEDLAQVRAENGQLLSEVGMLRDHLKQVEAERVRWQAIAATLLGRLNGIGDIIAGAVKAAIRDGFEAKNPDERQEDLERAGAEVAGILQRVGQNGTDNGAPNGEASPAAPLAQETPIPKVDFGGSQGPAEKAVYRR